MNLYLLWSINSAISYSHILYVLLFLRQRYEIFFNLASVHKKKFIIFAIFNVSSTKYTINAQTKCEFDI